MVTLIDSFALGSERLILIMTYYKTHLAKEIRTKKEAKLKFKDDVVYDWLAEMIEGLVFLHSNRIIHRDIKPANIFLTDDEHIRIGDLGVSGLKSENDPISSYYISPEMTYSNSNDNYSYNTDVWSVGCTIYELLTLQIYFFRKELNKNESNIYELNQLLELMLVEEKKNRIYSKELKEEFDRLQKNEVHNMTNGKYTRLSLIGSGAQGKIFLCKNITSKARVAIKIGLNAFAKNELDILKRVRNPFVVKFIESFSSPTSLAIVMEYCENGDMAKVIENRIKYDHQKIYHWLCEMIEGLDYLHSNSIIHRDIKPANIFITNEDHIKLGDFGVARKVFLDPDEECGAQLLFGSDIWAAGCTFYELITFEVYYDSNTFNKDESYFNELNDLLEMMLVEDPIKRGISKELKEIVFKQAISK